ncbi:hypothetical protein CRD60_06990 [Bifidobacterium aemilianum]|uniref:Uncharacterized protein n=1 Tax=Bifidobacterium aemilianum TaxID=2493120 RepID=A0A366K6J4_9BIFI|nr:hypothetical protein [Bifidobacterium aemilianum]RBP97365.1 hypothetical protein CRD60_06990 [Bifidobacterium aemilianum]
MGSNGYGLGSLKDDFFNFAKLTSLKPNGITCSSKLSSGAVTCKSELQIWVVDKVDGPSTVTLQPYAASLPLEQIVGLQLTITPGKGETLPADVVCSIDAGEVKWRQTALTDGIAGVAGKDVNPDNYPHLSGSSPNDELNTGMRTARTAPSPIAILWSMTVIPCTTQTWDIRR